MVIDNENRLFGLRIRRLREALGLTQHELAINADVSPKHLGELERGRGNPSLKSLQGLARALGISVGEIFDMEQEEKSDAVLKAEIIKRLQTANSDALRAIHKILKP